MSSAAERRLEAVERLLAEVTALLDDLPEEFWGTAVETHLQRIEDILVTARAELRQ